MMNLVIASVPAFLAPAKRLERTGNAQGKEQEKEKNSEDKK
jgi:hypothetical protein